MHGQIIDVWGQQAPNGGFPPNIFSRLIQQTSAEGRIEVAGRPDTLVAAMDDAGVQRLLLSAWRLPGKWMISNDDVAAFVRSYPDRFVGVGSVELTDPIAAAEEVDRITEELGFKALRVLPWVWRRPPSDALYYPLFLKCVERGIPFCTQVGHTGPQMPSEPGRPIPYIDEIALTFPTLKIVCGHIGYPWTDEMIALAWKHENVFIDTSAYRPKYYPPQLLHFMASYGAEKVLFGTNFPMLSLKVCAEDALGLNLPDAVTEGFLAGNAKRVFGLD